MSEDNGHERPGPHQHPASGGSDPRSRGHRANGVARPTPQALVRQPPASWGFFLAYRKTLCVTLVVLGTLLLLSTGVAGKDVAIFSSGGMVFVGVMGLALMLVFDKIERRQ